MRRTRQPFEDEIPTRGSLLSRLRDLQDDSSWQEFFETYWKLIYSAAVKAGLPDEAAQEVVQETVLTVSRSIQDFRYDPSVGSFKGWLLHTTRWRILDQLKKRKRLEENARKIEELEDHLDDESARIDATWEAEWQQNLVDAAIQRVKRVVNPKHFQAFELYTLKEWPAARVAKALGMNVAMVHLIKHRIVTRIRKETQRLEQEGL
jgi:RNA polymerase sigma-70 factor (ECF subfamily)